MNADQVLVVGASSDIGVALIHHLITTRKSRIIAHGNSSMPRLENLAATHSGHVFPVQADLADSVSLENMVETVRMQHGVPRGIVFLAGIPLRLERFSKWDAAHFRRDCLVQIEALVHVLRLFLPEMARRQGAVSKVVLVLSSVTVGSPPKFMSMYTAVKYAQLGLLRALAAEYANTSVRINAVSPAMVESRFLAGIPATAVEMSAAQMPGGRNLLPADIVDSISFLLDSGSDHLNGVNIPIGVRGVC